MRDLYIDGNHDGRINTFYSLSQHCRVGFRFEFLGFGKVAGVPLKVSIQILVQNS